MTVKYTEDHEWIKVDGDIGVVGISPYAAKALGDVVFVELPELGREMAKTVNASADGDGWFIKIKIADAGELDSLMDEAAYKTYCEGL